jgi:hypothetical protein
MIFSDKEKKIPPNLLTKAPAVKGGLACNKLVETSMLEGRKGDGGVCPD